MPKTLTADLIVKTALTLTLAAAAFLFFKILYPYHLTYHEQYQLFLFTGEYARGVLALPAGLAEYLSQWCIQWFRSVTTGAAIMAAALTAVQLLTWKLTHTRATWSYPLSFLPAVVLWIYLCDENAMPTAAFAVIIAQLVAWAVTSVSRTAPRLALIAAAVPVTYLLCGPLGLAIHPLIPIAREFARGQDKKTPAVVTAIIALALCWASVILSRYAYNYTLQRLATGIHYYRFPAIFPTLAWVGAATVTLIACLGALARPMAKALPRYATLAALAAAVVLGACKGVVAAMDTDKEEAMCYDYLVRSRQWGAILAKAREKNPDMPMTVACLNLALAKTGSLPDYMFHFYQNGTDGLIPPFSRDFTSPLPASEVFYHLGMINDSQRYTFEIQEAIPDYQKSVRCYKRLAETNLINGDYAAARKYLNTLSHTLAYDKWAGETMPLLGNEDAINSNPEYGWLRKVEFDKDVFFSDTEIYSMLGLLLSSSSSNRTAFEYLMAWALLAKDLNLFYQAYPLGKDMGYKHIPRSYQEALALIWVSEHTSWEGLPWSLSPQVMQGVVNFMNDYNSKMPAQDLQRKYADTYWAYYVR